MAEFNETISMRAGEAAIKPASPSTGEQIDEVSQWNYSIRGGRMSQEVVLRMVCMSFDPSLPRDTPDKLAWQADAVCGQTDPEAFFPKSGEPSDAAKLICKMCEVKSKCLEYALDNDERYGIWGGLSQNELRKLTKTQSR